ncbi:hypothetical protein EDD90_4715 [Streptomyces sp. Ag109_O5-1]|uniref:hypothetical protein n=1 Tax=Streptomyces sp. Ag109_O5-1 TaxID=1938851 RepID=UPI000F4DE375|nr:hypothetical protein [Streptomyces sp. Ag109_O5-1]RPE41625.1 hypothetical protein EDD90_4715 [Streptomyces sp. Ag109_O5-1]
MQSEPAIESHATVRGRRRKQGNGSAEGPVFVDSSGRRSKVLRRVGVLLGVVCLAYAGVLGAAFMGWGTSLTPSSLIPDFARGGSAPGGERPQGGIGRQIGGPSGRPSALPSATATPSAFASATAN